MRENNTEIIYSSVTTDELERAPKRVENLIEELGGIKKTYIIDNTVLYTALYTNRSNSFWNG
jgi:hypothetical protein